MWYTCESKLLKDYHIENQLINVLDDLNLGLGSVRFTSSNKSLIYRNFVTCYCRKVVVTGVGYIKVVYGSRRSCSYLFLVIKR